MSSGFGSDFKELVRARTNLVHLIGERVALQSRRGGREFIGLCPFHDDHDPSLRVDPERQSYKCWACGEGGDCFSFVEKTENVGFRDALELLATRANLEMPKGREWQPASDGKPTKKQLLDVLAWAEGEFHTLLRTSSEAAPVRDYLQSRGFTADTINRFRLGFHPMDWQFLQSRARGRFNLAQLSAARLIAERDSGNGFYDYFTGRVLFPIRDQSSRTVAFGGRVVPGIGPENAAKYWNSVDSPLFTKNKLVYALDVARNAIAERGAAVVMEGYADCIMAHQFGIANAVATLGTALTENHVAVLKRFTRKVVLVFDGDTAGKAAAEKSVPRFIAQDVDLRILTLTDAKDPADFLLAHGVEPFQAQIDSAVEAWEYKLRLCIERHGLSTIDAREQVVSEMLELFRQAPRFHGSDRENIVLNRLAFRVGISELRIRQMIAEGRAKKPAQNAGSANIGSVNIGSIAKTQQASGALQESELLEILLADPQTVGMIREEIGPADFKNGQYRELLELCYHLSDEGILPSYEKLISAVEDADLKRLVVTLDTSARSKGVARKLRVDSKAGEQPARPVMLSDAVRSLKERRRREEHEASKGLLATQSGPVGTLDPAQWELLRRSAETHAQRANARTTT